MEPEDSLERQLAEEIRAAVAQASPPPGPGNPAVEGSPDPLRAAEAHLTPSVPEGVRAERLKKLLLRGSRFLWRDQAAFNVLALEAIRRMRREWDERFTDFRRSTEDHLSDLRRRAAIQDARLGILEASPPARAASAGSSAAATPPALPPGVYSLFEERFRGPAEAIERNQRFYLGFLQGVPGPVLDVGCGRGEFLRLLREDGIAASGIESNPIAVRLCREAGLAVEEGDALALLAARPAGALGGVVAFQVVEHWPAAQIFAFLREARRALKPDGVLIAETVNTDSLSALRAFFLDPTHVRPVPPAALEFLAEAAGFAGATLEYRAPLPAEERLEETTGNDVKLNRLLFGPQDYALVARVPRA